MKVRMPRKLTERQAWLKLARTFSKPRSERWPYNSLCVSLSRLCRQGFITEDLVSRMVEKIQVEVRKRGRSVYLYPTSWRGRRAAFCRNQAKRCQP